MAGTEGSSPEEQLKTTSYDTALCIIPPLNYCKDVDTLRELYDNGYGRWPPHINLLYPFVAIDALPRAKELLQANVAANEVHVRLDGADSFAHRNNYTVFACENSVTAKSGPDGLEYLRNACLAALGQPKSSSQLHLTVGQSLDQTSRDFLLDKVSCLPQCEFTVADLAILVRERQDAGRQDKAINQMRLWGFVNIVGTTTAPIDSVSEFWISEPVPDHALGRSEKTFVFDHVSATWQSSELSLQSTLDCAPEVLEVSTYNVLADTVYTGERDLSLLQVLTSKAALADVLILEEVTDQFLGNLLSCEDVRAHYTYSSHGPSTQPEIGPLPNMRNIVVLSRFAFRWTGLAFQQRHKGAIIAQFADIGTETDSGLHPLVLAGIHLTSGLTSNAVTAKKTQIDDLLAYLQREHVSSPWIVAGDFNITTSAVTINAGIKDKLIARQTADILESIDSDIIDAGLVDSWSMARMYASDDSIHDHPASDARDLHEGEEGATFNPGENPLAAESSDTSKERPQRYDRILLKGQDLLRVAKFNMFGHIIDEAEAQSPEFPVPSDHYGIRASFNVGEVDGTVSASSEALRLPQLQIKAVPTSLTSQASLTEALAKHNMFPTEDEVGRRKEAFCLLKDVLSRDPQGEAPTQSHMLLVTVPVGSYALNVWTTASDIDCVCIGNISSLTFFKLARQRIRRAANEDIRVIRKVDANSGTLLELSVKGIHLDLHYSPAARVVKQWSELPQISHSDPSFDLLPILALRKTKPFRDLDYIQRSLPDTAVFRLAYRCIKLWAVQNGLYSSRFGYLGGIHITLMLAVICKRVVHQIGAASVETVISTFFNHYANFDWKNDMVYDTFFHKTRPTYHRTPREPVLILGYHKPNANVAHTSTLPGLDVLVKEFKTARRRLSDPSMTWEKFFSSPTGDNSLLGHTQFLSSYDSFVQLGIQYWGRTQSNGRSFVGWIESRTLLLVVDIKRVAPNLEVRIWPARFTSSGPDSETDYYQGSYLIGLSKRSETGNTPADSARQGSTDSLLTAIKRFEQQMRSDEKYYDVATSWIGVDLVKRKDLGPLSLDEKDWGEPEDEGEDDSDFEDEHEQEAEAVSDEDRDARDVRQLPMRNRARGPVIPDAKKLRPATDILNRLRWDPNLDLGDYVVGYLDRFLGAMEMPLEKWKNEQTDEEFIPMHRILFFKQKSNGLVVWERGTRIDRIFGSGAGDGGQGLA